LPGRPGPPDGRSEKRKRRDAILLGVGFVAILGGIGVVGHLRSQGKLGGTATVAANEEESEADGDNPRQPLTDRSWLQRTLIGEDYAPKDGNRTFGNVVAEDSGTSAMLPFKMSSNALNGPGASVEMSGGQIAGGWITAPQSELKSSMFQKGVNELKVPDGMRLLQVRYQPKAMLTIVGQVFNYIGQINQYWAVDANGTRYPLTGYWAVANRKDGGYLELFYNGDPDEPTNPGYSCMLDFKVLQRPDINDRNNTVLYLLFLVPADAEIKRIENQVGDGDDVDFKPPQ
jgi:hypothetical protein